MKIKSDHPTTLAGFLKEVFPEASGSTVKKWILHGLVSINGKIVKRPDIALKPGDEVEYHKKGTPLDTPDLPFPVLYMDDDIIAVDKPAGLLTYGERGTSGTSVYKILTDYIKDQTGPRSKIFVVHRLDREVSGVLLFARSEEIQKIIKENWKNNVKKYYALVEGCPQEKSGTLKNWLRENKLLDVETVKESENAKFAITHYRVIKKLDTNALLEVTLETGRKHQIRVQLSEIGCPVVGDRRYGADASVIRRIRLHSFSLKIKHPSTGHELMLESPMPDGFLTLGTRDEQYKKIKS
ncbi:MAG: RluA family pseudouridine synthase [Bacteroidota bacterium]|nr:RluA family pseudouridine synthase [Bacteroidota bacterium]